MLDRPLDCKNKHLFGLGCLGRCLRLRFEAAEVRVEKWRKQPLRTLLFGTKSEKAEARKENNEGKGGRGQINANHVFEKSVSLK